MSIIRAPRPQAGYYVLDQRIAEDERLSWAARGLLVYLLVKPDNWRVSVAHLRRQTEAARVVTRRDGIYALLAELEAAGYVRRHQARGQDGRLGQIEYVVSEVPSEVPLPAETTLPAEPPTAEPLPGEPYPAQPYPAQPYTAQPYTAQPTLINTQYSANTQGVANTHTIRTSAEPTLATQGMVSAATEPASTQGMESAKMAMATQGMGGTHGVPIRATRTRRATAQDEVALPEWMPVDAWEGWLEVRRKLRAPNTAHAMRLAIKHLDQLRALGHDPRDVLEQSAARGWRGLFPVRHPEHPGGNHDHNPLARRRGESDADYSARLNRIHDERERAAYH